MAYSDFKTLSQVQKEFALRFIEKVGPFAATPERPAGDYLRQTLDFNVGLALASNTEKARSGLIVAPILVAAYRQMGEEFSLFSGVEFTIDAGRGLSGFCDFIISNGQERLFIVAPALMLVEAKKEDLKAGLGQCVAEMYAAQIFNEREGVEREYVYGAVISGTAWMFLRLKGNIVEIDLSEYYLVQIDKILGLIALAVS
jgi:hypothetical protein